MYKNRKLHGEPFNFGPKQSQNKNVITLVKMMKKFWSNVSWKEYKNYKELYESKLLKLNSKAKKKLKWIP